MNIAQGNCRRQAAKNTFEGPKALVDLAEVDMLAGRHDEAIDLLGQLLRTVYENSLTPVTLRIDPDWNSLREHPRFEHLLTPVP